MCRTSAAARLLGLTTIALAWACSRAGLVVTEDYGLAGIDGAELAAHPDGGGDDQADPYSAAPAPTLMPSGGTAADGGCSASILTYVPTDPTLGICWTETKQQCASELSTCAADCACNDAVARALACANGGQPIDACFESAFSSAGDSTLTSTRACLLSAYPRTSCYGQTRDAGPPTPPGDAACTTLVGSGGGGNGKCSYTAAATCNGTNYQVSCACPRGSCACFGPTTHVVSFPGCPYCPTSGLTIGPTTVAQVFALCGFPTYPQ